MCRDLVIRMGLFIIRVSAISTLLLHTSISKKLHITFELVDGSNEPMRMNPDEESDPNLRKGIPL